MEEIIIQIFEHSEGGYEYNIYENESDLDENVSLDGGLCTGTLMDALGMAMEQSKVIIKKLKK